MENFIKTSESVTNQLGKLDHLHILIKAFVSNPPTEGALIETWLKELVDDIGMKIVVGPFSEYVEAVGNAGLTAGVLIETSHCAIHVWSESVPAMIQMDVYSCSCFKPEDILKKLSDFGLLSYEMMLIDRNANFKVIKSEIID